MVSWPLPRSPVPLAFLASRPQGPSHGNPAAGGVALTCWGMSGQALPALPGCQAGLTTLVVCTQEPRPTSVAFPRSSRRELDGKWRRRDSNWCSCECQCHRRQLHSVGFFISARKGSFTTLVEVGAGICPLPRFQQPGSEPRLGSLGSCGPRRGQRWSSRFLAPLAPALF